MKQNIVKHRKKILNWYIVNKRDLPWRETLDPYKIWVSEIILQQTQVKTGLAYYERFVERFPVIECLAAAEESEILKLWQGLGYYSRARNMHFAAKQVMSEYMGVFPSDYDGVISLKGVGEYTASAILSIAYNLPYAVVDGNVIRVISRLHGISDPVDVTSTQKQIASISDALLDRNNPGDFNQALMEFGALYCVPQNPSCEKCVLKKTCLAYAKGIVSILPKKTKKVKVRTRYFNYLVIKDEETFYLQKRTSGDIWQGLYEYPLIESKTKLSIEALSKAIIDLFNSDSIDINCIKKLWGPKKHILSHQVIHTTYYEIDIGKEAKLIKNWLKVNKLEKDAYPVARITELFWEESRKKISGEI